MAKLNVKALGLSLGIIWSVALVIMGILATIFPDYAGRFVLLLSTVYVGYKATILGIIIGAIWGFVDAGIFGLILGWLYNKLSK